MFIVIGFPGGVRDSRNHFLLVLNPPNKIIQRHSREIQFAVREYVVENLKILNIESLYIFEKARAEHPDDPSYKFLKILNMGSISINKHEIEILNVLQFH